MFVRMSAWDTINTANICPDKISIVWLLFVYDTVILRHGQSAMWTQQSILLLLSKMANANFNEGANMNSNSKSSMQQILSVDEDLVDMRKISPVLHGRMQELKFFNCLKSTLVLKIQVKCKWACRWKCNLDVKRMIDSLICMCTPQQDWSLSDMPENSNWNLSCK